LLFTYAVIVASHLKFRKKNGCPEKGGCQLPGYPYTSWITLSSLVAIIVSMPLVPGQGAGLVAGLSLLTLYSFLYIFMKRFKVVSPKRVRRNTQQERHPLLVETMRHQPNMETSEELIPKKDKK
jgi:L-asparagine transporter-like permease